MTQTYELGRVKGTRNGQLLCAAIFNILKINAGMLAIGSEDTLFEYVISSDQKRTKPQLVDARMFVTGFIESLRATGNL